MLSRDADTSALPLPRTGPAMRRLPALTALTLVLASCASGPSGEDAPATAPRAAGPRTPGPPAAADLPGGELVRCESPAGFTLGRPATWSTNSGDVVPTCSQLHPEPFEVLEGTDVRLAAITAYIDPVPFAEVAALDAHRDADRAVTTIDGLLALRLEYVAGREAFWPEGTSISLYAVDLTPGPGDEPRTLFLDTVGLEGFDYEQNRVVLDRIARSLDVTLDGVESDPRIVARYPAGGGFRVEAEVRGGEACLRVPPGGEPVCAELPAADQVHTIQLTAPEGVLAGVAGRDVFRVTAERRRGEPSTYLPAPIPGGDVGGFSFTFGLDAVVRLILHDITGNELRSIEPGG